MSDEPLKITVRPYHWEVDDRAIDGEFPMIRVWALDVHNNPYLLRVESFPYSCVIQLPIVVNRRRVNWTSIQAGTVYKAIVSAMNNKEHIYSYSHNNFVYKKLLYDLQLPETKIGVAEELRNRNVGTFPMIYMYFKTRKAMYEVHTKLGPNAVKVPGLGTIPVRVWETDIDIITKLLAYTGTRRCSWITAVGKHVPRDISILTSEFIVNWTTIRRVPDSECALWRTTPGVFSWDIECYSPNHNKFPDMWDPACVQYMITCNFRRGVDTTYVRLIIMGDCRDISLEGMNIEIVRVQDTEEMARAFADAIRDFDPEILTGFRVQSFDCEYFDARIGMDLLTWPVCGRLKNQQAYIRKSDKQSGAYGFNKMYYFHTPGRITIDIYQYFRREYKYPEYNLNYISRKHLRDQKNDISAKEMFKIYELMTTGIAAGKGSKEYELGIDEMTRTAAYCIQDAQLVLRLFDHVNLWLSMVEMSNIMCVNIYDLYTSGQQIRCFNQLAMLAFEESVILTSRPPEDIKFKGGQVQEPKTGIHDMVMCIDFNSLYPSIMIDKNICYTTLIPEDKWRFIPDEMCNTITVDISDNDNKSSDSSSQSDSDDDDTSTTIRSASQGEITVKFIKREFVEGLLPKLVDKLIKERRAVQAQLKNGYDVVLDKRQLAIKISANSFFGFTGTGDKGIRPCARVAISITGWGREYISRTNRNIVENGGEVIYGDTDSALITDKSVAHPSQCAKCIETICERVTALFPGGVIVMKPEYWGKLLTVKKKKYAIVKYDKDGNLMTKEDGSLDIEVKGLMSVRREFCKWARDTFQKILSAVMNVGSFVSIIRYLIDRIKALLNGEISHRELLMNSSVSASYKNESYPIKIFADKLRAIGKQVDPGERLYYIVRKFEAGERLHGERLELEETYAESLDTDNPIKIDYGYYIENVLCKHVDDLILVAYPKEIEYLSEFQYLASENSTSIRLDQPVKFIHSLIEDDISIDTFFSDFERMMQYFDPENIRMPTGI